MAKQVGRDSGQMRSIALLTMTFLPITTVAVCKKTKKRSRLRPSLTHSLPHAEAVLASLTNSIYRPEQTIFSTSFFDWTPAPGAAVSRDVWILAVVAAGLTIVTVSSWWLVTKRQLAKQASELHSYEMNDPATWPVCQRA